ALDGYLLTHAGQSSRFLHLVRYRHADGSTPSVAETRGLVAVLAGRPGVRFATVNRWHFPTATPDDPLYKPHWRCRTITLPAAWDTAPQAPGVVVAVVDSGIRSHPDLEPRVLPGADMVSDPTNAGDGDGRDSSPNDEGKDLPRGGSSWHGTHVSGT